MHGGSGGGQLSQQTDHRAEEQFGNRDRVAGWRIDDGDAQRRGHVERDVVDADTGASDHLEFRAGLQQFGRDACGAATHDGIVIADAAQQVVLGERGQFVHLQRGFRGEEVYAFLVDIVGDEDAEHQCVAE